MKYLSRSSVGLLLLVLLSLGSGHAQAGPEEDPLLAAAAGLAQQSGEGDDIRSVFTGHADRVRLMVLLSPT